MIIIYDKANTLNLSYVNKEGAVQFKMFVPGRNEVDSEIWEAIVEANKKRFDHYARFLHALDEVAAGDDGIDYAALSVKDLSKLIDNTFDIEKLVAIETAENEREQGGRKSVLKEIDKQIDLISKEEAKLEKSRD